MVYINIPGDPSSSNIGSAFLNLLEDMVKNSKEWNWADDHILYQ
jgi:hypothetical protein